MSADGCVNSRVVGVAEFKSKCVALLDEIGGDRETITITKRRR